MRKSIFLINVHDMVEIAMFVSLAIVLDQFVKIPLGASGGSINIAMFPLIILALRHGPFKAFIAGGIIFGLISCLLDMYGFNFYFFDYLIAFGGVFTCGLVAKYIYLNYNSSKIKTILCYLYLLLAILAFGVIRVLSASIDSMIFYELNFIDSLIYNFPYVFLSLAFVAILSLALLFLINKVNHQFKTKFLKDIK